MSKHLGDFDTSAVVYGKFTTYRPSTGAPYTLAGTPALSVYKDNSTTQSTTGVTLTADFDTVTGLNHFAIDTSADGTFYSSGSFFDIVVTTGTVDSVSAIGMVVGSFTLRKNSALKPATAGRALVVDAAGLADANMVKAGPSGSGTAQTARDIGASVLISSGTGTGQLDVSSGVIKANLAQILGTALTETAGQIAAGFKKVFDVAAPVFTAASVNQTGDSYARLGAPAGASVSADVAAVKTDTGNLVTRITSTLFSGITSLKEWLGLIAGKQTGNSTARTELRATGAGSGTYDETTDSQEAIRDNMGTAQTGDAYAIVNNGTYGNSALNTDLDALLARLTATRAGYLDKILYIAASTQGVSSGYGTGTVTFYDDDGTTARLIVTISAGNRTAITRG